MKLPKEYAWLANEPGPRILITALALYGTTEVPGPGSNPSILQWAKATGQDHYIDDDTAWCGLFVAYVALQSGWDQGMPVNPLAARNWLQWGTPVKTPMLGDLLIFWREQRAGFKGHVGFYAGETKTHYLVLGGNQRNSVSFAWIEKKRLLGARRCKWKISQPGNVRVITLTQAGPASKNEA